MSLIDKIKSNSSNIKNNELILKAFGIEKARSGIYEDDLQNRKLGRVGQHYGNLREVSLDKYKSQFEDYTNKPFSEIERFYKEGNLKSLTYLIDKKDVHKSLIEYRGSNYRDFRSLISNRDKFIKEKPSLVEGYDKAIKDVSKYIQDNKIDKNLVLNRRVHSDKTDFFSNLNVGDVYEDKSFSSTSLQELSFFGDFNIKILCKKGSSVANGNNISEYEYIIDKNSQFRVLEKGHKSLTVELL